MPIPSHVLLIENETKFEIQLILNGSTDFPITLIFDSLTAYYLMFSWKFE